MRRGLTLEPVYDIFGYSVRHRDVCPRMNLESITRNRNADFMNRMAVRGSFKWVLAHEVSHHLVGMKGRSPAGKRADEEAADRRALQLLVRSGTNPIESLAIFTLFGALDDYPTESDPEDDHPPTGQRLLSVVKMGRDLLENDSEFDEALRQYPGGAKHWRETMDQLERGLR